MSIAVRRKLVEATSNHLKIINIAIAIGLKRHRGNHNHIKIAIAHKVAAIAASRVKLRVADTEKCGADNNGVASEFWV
ncbi:hypothetical protein L195_g010953 [Trifolium pratense]|uniref:Uncharacterized protein n=1 Tax=Trifolium pratense TaxID=57577 RepID=A0A2K3PG55_TRIPR|nr:hypothetical protein L195_g010953 [Trifolium pratense]